VRIPDLCFVLLFLLVAFLTGVPAVHAQPANDDLETATPLSGLPQDTFTSFSLAGAAPNGGADISCDSSGYDIWYRYDPPQDEVFHFDVAANLGAPPDAQFGLTAWMDGILYYDGYISCVDRAPGLQSLDFNVFTGHTYYIQVHAATTTYDGVFRYVTAPGPSDECQEAMDIEAGPLYLVNNLGAARTIIDVPCNPYPAEAGGGVFFRYSSSVTENVTVTVDYVWPTFFGPGGGNQSGTLLSARQGCAGGVEQYFVCDRGYNRLSMVTFRATPGNEYFIRVDTMDYYGHLTHPLYGPSVGGFTLQLDTVALPDCNGNGIPDEDEIADGTANDCNSNGIPDLCEIEADPFLDTNGDGYLDTCGVLPETLSFDLIGTPAIPGVKLTGTIEGQYFQPRYSVSGAGDVDGDGFEDVIIGSVGNGAFVVYGPIEQGEIFIPDEMTSSTRVAWLQPPEDSSEYVGRAVSGAGDVNGDGYADLLVGDPWADIVWGVDGQAFLIYGKPRTATSTGLPATLDDLDGENGVRFLGFEEGGYVGDDVSGAGDVNGDGYDDLLLGFRYGAFLLFGSSSGIGSGGSLDLREIGSVQDAGRKGVRITKGDYQDLGPWVSGAGDVNGDGYEDLVIDAATDNQPRVIFLFGSALDPDTGAGIGIRGLLNVAKLQADTDNDGIIDRVFGIQSNVLPGYAVTEVSGAGDVNADGYADVIVALTGEGAQTTDPSVVLYGATLNPGNASVQIQFPVPNDLYSYTRPRASGAGDTDGDGYADLLIGAGSLVEDIGVRDAAYLVSGEAVQGVTQFSLLDLNGENGSAIYSGFDFPLFGSSSHLVSVSSAGDWNADGVSDIVMGRPFYGVVLDVQDSPGQSYVVNGRPQSPWGVYRNRIRHGVGPLLGTTPTFLEIPPIPIGTLANGAQAIPFSRVAMGFKGGETGTEGASLQTVTIRRQAVPHPFIFNPGAEDEAVFQPLPVYWRIQTDRADFDESTIDFHYTVPDVEGLTDLQMDSLGVFYSEVDPKDPTKTPLELATSWTPLPARHNRDKRTLTIVRENLYDEDNPRNGRDQVNGYYTIFIGQIQYELGSEVVPTSRVDMDRVPNTGPVILPLDAAFWHPPTRKLYAVKTYGNVIIQWVDKDNPAIVMDTIITSFIWPGEADDALGYVSAPVYQPFVLGSGKITLKDIADDAGNTIQYVEMTDTETDADPGAVKNKGEFAPVEKAGRSLLMLANGSNPLDSDLYFQFVWVLPYDYPFFQWAATIDVGTDLGLFRMQGALERVHDTDAGEPYLLNVFPYYCADEGYYDLEEAPNTGPLIPVNLDLDHPESTDDVRVAMYERGQKMIDPLDRSTPPSFEVYWPYRPMEFTLRWPDPVSAQDTVVIASQLGTGPLPDTIYEEPALYVQNDPEVTGFNPNDEHAVMILESEGYNVYALRDDLARPDTSEPFVLLKYKDQGNMEFPGRPAIHLFKVVATDPQNDFYYGEQPAYVGDLIQPPHPLRNAMFLPCNPSEAGATDGSFTSTPDHVFQDRLGRFWVKSSGPDDDSATSITFHYFYPILPDFYLPEEYKDALRTRDDIYPGAEEEQFLAGTCIPWLDDWWDEGADVIKTDTVGVPLAVGLKAVWPVDAPVLFAAETLVDPKRGLPGLTGADSVDLLAQQSLLRGMGESVQLIDPTRARWVPFARDDMPAAIKLARVKDLLEFEELPDHIRRRFKYDDNAERLMFFGQYVRFVTGEDMLLPNIMTRREKDVILGLTEDLVVDNQVQRFNGAVESVFEKTQPILKIAPTTFLPREIVAPGGAVLAGLGRVDSDAYRDVVALIDGTLRWYQNTYGDASSWVASDIRSFDPGKEPVRLEVADLDSDSDADIVYLVPGAEVGRYDLYVEINVSVGETWNQVRINGDVIRGVDAISVGDLDADGRLDILVAGDVADYEGELFLANLDPISGQYWVDLNHNGFTEPDELFPQMDLYWIDSNGNGMQDAGEVFLEPQLIGSDGAYWYQYNGSSADWPRFNILVGTAVGAIAAADMDDDGFQDIVAASGSVSWYRNDQTPTRETTSDWAEHSVGTLLDTSDVAVADVDGDDDLDVAASDRAEDSVRWFENRDGVGDDWRIRDVSFSALGVEAIEIADLDLDGDLDFVSANAGGDQLAWHENVGTLQPIFESHFIPGAHPGVDGVSVGDLNGDLYPDLMASGYTGALSWHESDGASRGAWDTLALTAGVSQGNGFVTLAFNNDEDSQGEVTVEVIRVECPLYRGDVKIIYPSCPFSDKVALRHNGDFAGQADNFRFEWKFMDAATYLEILQDTGSRPQPTDPHWVEFLLSPSDQVGAVDINLAGAGNAEFILTDKFWITRYDPVDPASVLCQGPSPWTDVGPLTEGWVKRVVGDFGPFRQRATGGGIQGAEDNFVDYTNRTVNTVVSMIEQAGERWEGNVPLTCNNVDGLGLIEVYQSVLNQASKLSIDAAPRRDLDDDGDGLPDAGVSAGVSNALLLAAGRIADLYALVGNEAYADAADPTIAFGTDDGVFGPVASAIHCFMNQTSSLLEEELDLLRGRDDSSFPLVTLRPIYNRLIWNFTGDTTGGEVAYALNYAISDRNDDGLIDELDAAKMYPQGHGDAWGHYLSALKAYYALIRHPEYAWEPRTEPVLVGGTAVEVDYYDERKFAGLAAQLAQTGSEIVNLTYRAFYVESPEEQWQGYKDSSEGRYWGVSEWASRAGQSAYLNWVVANALLPPGDGGPDPQTLRKVDRDTVKELQQIEARYEDIQRKVDEADAGLNPLGLARNAVPFDLNPALLEDSSPQTHFEQIYERTATAFQNALRAFDYASAATLALRQQADRVAAFQTTVDDQEIDFRNRLIEQFGTPYPDDIGPGRSYRQGYNGPDLLHWGYFDPSQLQELGVLEGLDLNYREIKIRLKKDITYSEIVDNLNYDYFDFSLQSDPDFVPPPPNVGTEVEVTYNLSDRFGLTRPPEWTAPRRVTGEIQLAHMELMKAITGFQKKVDDYSSYVAKVDDKAKLIEAQYNIKSSQIQIRFANNIAQGTLEEAIFLAKTAEFAFSQLKETTTDIGDAAKEAMPKVNGFSNDFTSPVRFTVAIATTGTNKVFAALEIISKLLGDQLEIAKNVAQRQSELALEVASDAYEIQQSVAEMRELLLNESTLRFELLQAEQEIAQASAKYRNAIAKGQQLIEERNRFRTKTAASTQSYRYKDMAFRIFRNEGVQKFRAAFDLAGRYAYLAAKAYDYETNLLGADDRGPGQEFLTGIVRARSLGQIRDGEPLVGGGTGDPGLADPLARMKQNWDLVLKSQLGFNNPQTETNRFSMRRELFRIGLQADAAQDPSLGDSDAAWRSVLSRPYGSGNSSGIVSNILTVPEFRRYAIPFSTAGGDPLLAEEPAIVIHFGTNVNFAKNFFVNLDPEGGPWPLGAGDSAYDTANFATKIRSVGAWFVNYNRLTGGGMSNTPRIYLFPFGDDILRSPTGNRGEIRMFRILDQAIPAPFPVGGSQLGEPDWKPITDTLAEGFITLRRFPSFRAYHSDVSYLSDPDELDTGQLNYDSRLIGRSVWNSDWMLIIPGGTLHSDRSEGIRRFIYGRAGPANDGTFILDDLGQPRDGNGVKDILIFFQTYAYSGI